MQRTIEVNPPSGDADRDTMAVQNAINVCPIGGIVLLSLNTYLINRTLVVPRTMTVRGYNMRGTSLRWAGNDPGANMLLLAGSDDVDNVLLSDFALDNEGLCNHAIFIETPQTVTLSRIFSNSARRFETALVQTNTQGTVYHIALRDCKFHVRSADQITPIGVGLATGHTHSIDHCMFSGFKTAVRVGQTGELRTTRVDGFSMVGSRVESDDRADDPIGVDIVQVAGLNLVGNSFEMDGLKKTAGGPCAVLLRYVLGGLIAGNYMAGNEVCRSLIQLHNREARAIVIHGNTFLRVHSDSSDAVAYVGGDTGQFQTEVGRNHFSHNPK